jgi:hypothetical protein
MNSEETSREGQHLPWRQLIDCCRPGSDDASQPEMAELEQGLAADADLRALYERSQQFDTAVAAAFHDVPIPEGLVDRLQSNLARRQTDAHCQVAAEHEEAGRHVLPASASVPKTNDSRRSTGVARLSRFRWAAVGIASAAALLLVTMLGYAFLHWRPAAVSTDEVIKRALQWTAQVKERSWNVDMSQAPLQAFPREPSLRAAPLRWQKLTTGDGRDVVAYDLTPPGKSFVAQFTMPVSPSVQFDLSGRLPSQPNSSTGGFCIGACVRDGHLYVLVVEGDAARYRQFVRPEPPVT